MDQEGNKGISWIPWKKMNKLIPIKKKQQTQYRTAFENPFGKYGKVAYLPKLNVKKMYFRSIRTRSPISNCQINQKKEQKQRIFSPVLKRGGTADYSNL